MTLTLLPIPQKLEVTDGQFELPDEGLIVLDMPNPQLSWVTALFLQETLAEYAGVEYELVAGTAVPQDQVRIQLSIVAGHGFHEQGYELTVQNGRVDVVAQSAQGLFYGVQTLIQIIEQTGYEIPVLRCTDWPDFPNRGILLDISRDKVPTMETLYDLVEMFASWKINQLQLYTEHTFAYRNHPIIWQDASPMTAEEILDLDSFCRDRFIELVPNQNTFGHMHRWLEHEEYAHLAEKIDGADTPWGFYNPQPFSLAPVVPESIDLVRDMLDELLPNFSSTQVNVGADETYDVGQGLSKDLVEEKGKGRVYLDHLLKIYREVKTRGCTMQFWGDIIMEHPELAAELPRDVIALEWGYEANSPFAEHGKIYAQSGVPFYVCGGTSSWNNLVGFTDKSVANLKNAAENGIKNGAIGFLNTDWGDNHHWQPLPTSFLPFAVGAAVSWANQANKEIDIPAVLNQFVFRDEKNVIGQLVYDLGNVHQTAQIPAVNGNALFYSLQATKEKIIETSQKIENKGKLLANLDATLHRIDAITVRLPDAAMLRDDADLILQEFIWAANMLRHACKRIRWAISDNPEKLQSDLIDEAEALLVEFERIWNGRNRPGGFADSVTVMQQMRESYA